MPRPIQPPRLYLRKKSRRRPAQWIIIDRGRQFGTGALASDRDQAHAALAAYLAERHAPQFRDGDPARVLIVDALAAYAEHHAPTIALKSQQAVGSAALQLAAFFQSEAVASVTEQRCRDYVAWRTRQVDPRYRHRKAPRIAPATARRELVVLSAALNWCYRNRKIDRPIAVALPPAAQARERHLTRREAAVLIAGALGFYRRGGRWRRDHARINRHLARFILLALYTGTRHDAILKLQWRRNAIGGHVDLAAGVIYRRPAGAIERRKRRPPLPIPPRLAPHLRRWRALGEADDFLIAWRGRPFAGPIRTAWERARALAALDDEVTPHILRHTCATWLLQAGVSIFDVAGVLGCSEAVVRDTYGHHAQDHLAAALSVFSRRA